MQSAMLMLASKPFDGGAAGDVMRGPAGDMMRGGHPGGFFLGGLFSVVWTVIIVLLVLWVVRHWSSPRNPITAFTRRAVSAVQSTASSVSSVQAPLEILQARYAKGEIDRDAYETIRRDLAGESSPAQPSPAEGPAAQA